MHRSSPIRLAAALTAAAACTALAGCAPGAAADEAAQVVVRIAPSAQPVDLEVHVAEAAGGYRAVQRMRSGESRTFRAPAGWLTVRVPGLCVVPARASGTAVVEVDRHACRLV